MVEAQQYLLNGVMPMIYKYITGFLNLTNYRNIQEMNNNLTFIILILKDLSELQELIIQTAD